MSKKQEYLQQDIEEKPAGPPAPRLDAKPVKKRRLRFLVMTLVVTGTIAYLMFSGMQDTMGYYLTVTEVLAQDVSQTDKGKLRVSGTVEEGSLKWNPGRKKIRFSIADEQTRLPVEYEGIVPDTLKNGQKVIVEGVFVDGTFIASDLMTSCASKYE